MILFIDACVRAESRTRRLTGHILKDLEGEVQMVRLAEASFPAVDEAFLSFRNRCVAAGDYSDPVFAPARQFARADTIVIAAPFWDLSFPSVLKQYLEQICVTGITFRYTEEGVPVGLCRAKDLWYVTTAGGPILSEAFGFGYVEALAKNFFGIHQTHLIRAEGLDIVGADVEAILRAAVPEKT